MPNRVVFTVEDAAQIDGGMMERAFGGGGSGFRVLMSAVLRACVECRLPPAECTLWLRKERTSSRNPA